MISDAGRVRLGQSLQPTEKLDAARVWDLARDAGRERLRGDRRRGQGLPPRGEGRRLDRRPTTRPTPRPSPSSSRPDGHVFVGTGPGGPGRRPDRPEASGLAPDPDVQYIWDLAADAEGNLYAATGPTGQLWKRAPQGDWSLLLDSKHPHLLCVAVGPDGSVYAGSDGEGLIYRVAPDGKMSVVYDAPQNEIRTLLFAPTASLYAGTAAESGGGGGSGRGSSSLLGAIGPAPPERRPGRDARRRRRTATRGRTHGRAESRLALGQPPARRVGRPSRRRPGDNAVYRIGADGVAREVFRARVLVYALAWQGDRLLVGTGPEGQLYEVREQGRESAPIARLDNGQILALLADPSGGLLVGAGDPGASSG